MKSNKYVKISIPLSLKQKAGVAAEELGMNTSSFVRFKLFEAIKNNHVMSSIPTMKCDAYLKFRAPVELVHCVELQASASNVSVSTYIRVLLFYSVLEKEVQPSC